MFEHFFPPLESSPSSLDENGDVARLAEAMEKGGKGEPLRFGWDWRIKARLNAQQPDI